MGQTKKAAKKGPREQVIQRQVMCWLKSMGIFAWYVKSTGTYDPVRKVFRKPPSYFTRGVPDVHILSNGVYVAIELKSLTGRLSDDQKAFHEQFAKEANPPRPKQEGMRPRPPIYIRTAYSLLDVKEICEDFGLVPSTNVQEGL